MQTAFCKIAITGHLPVIYLSGRPGILLECSDTNSETDSLKKWTTSTQLVPRRKFPNNRTEASGSDDESGNVFGKRNDRHTSLLRWLVDIGQGRGRGASGRLLRESLGSGAVGKRELSLLPFFIASAVHRRLSLVPCTSSSS